MVEKDSDQESEFESSSQDIVQITEDDFTEYMELTTDILRDKLDSVEQEEVTIWLNQLKYKQKKLQEIMVINQEQLQLIEEYQAIDEVDFQLQNLIDQVYNLQVERLEIIQSEIRIQDHVFNIEKKEITHEKNQILELLKMIDSEFSKVGNFFKK